MSRAPAALAALGLAIAGCWRDSAPPPVLSNAPPPQRDPAPKVAEFGVFDDPRGEPFAGSTFRQTNAVYMHEGVSFGWRIRLPCRSATPRRYRGDPRTVPDDLPELVEFREVMQLPAPGDWSTPLEKTVITNDGKVATTVDEAECFDGWIAHRWSISAHDPPGPWVVTVEIKGYATSTFRATFVGTHASSPSPPSPSSPPPAPSPSPPSR